jgi:hypothetical protein
MTFEKRDIMDELDWHFENPVLAYKQLTEPEKREIVKKGFVTKELRDTVAQRLAADSESLV